MEQIIEWIRQPWPWYVAGPLLGLTVPVLLILGNKSFGVSSSLRHICAACVPAKIPFFSYDWKKEMWNILFVTGILIGGIIAGVFLADPDAVVVAKRGRQCWGSVNTKICSPQKFFPGNTSLHQEGLYSLFLGDLWWALEPAMQEDVLQGMPSWGSVICNGLLWWPPYSLCWEDLPWRICYFPF